ncbi:GGDEF domain-containing protein [Brumicola nitratireducens]|uniref:diguanylate cyclase n=1 Tax=Glaciecola nitratireducens (strain JCM 12485 / KCTC 12276 / FR1064) TaxID=1085623 RepID=G4QM01_GLANF|nr:GGDEF domain-containing protein [Glaciecola nitratireducens]AEP30572.1 GGDEF domain protein [Glaciecola nitratireducens FR1064]
MTEVSPKKQLMVARQYLDKLSIFIVNMANFYQGANPTFDQELVMLKKQLSGKPDYDAATQITGKLNAVLTKDTKFFKQRNLDSVSHLQNALKKLSNIKNVSADVKTEVSEFLISLSPDKHAVVAPLAQFEKALLLYNKALQFETDSDKAKTQTPEQIALHNSITQELKELITPFYVGNKSDKNLQEIYRKLNIGLDHKELLECCLIMIRFVIRDVIKEATATSRLISNLHKSLTTINDDINTNIADSEKRFEERVQYNSEIKEHITEIESVVSDSQQLDELKEQAKQHLDKMQASLKASAAAEQKEQAATINMMKKMQERVVALEAEASTYKQKLFTQRVAALSDQLTKLPNRMAYEEKAQFEVQRAQKTGSPLCIAIVDIDHFKKINDSYGHSVGDKTLQVIAKHIRQYLPKEDFVARWGGEEFVMLLPNSSIQQAFDKVELVREKVSALPFKFKGQRVTVTLSCGLSQITQKITLEEAFEKADTLLYKAKDAGRNKTLFEDIE